MIIKPFKTYHRDFSNESHFRTTSAHFRGSMDRQPRVHHIRHHLSKTSEAAWSSDEALTSERVSQDHHRNPIEMRPDSVLNCDIRPERIIPLH